ncbi:hypothetical protein F5Y16DRAFT_405087 [Xylariaceae sp. FL0255]|nr:hypothetical protein F5Y16DRAFT_405087 [Xylariaceae sp. FL0255]
MKLTTIFALLALALESLALFPHGNIYCYDMGSHFQSRDYVEQKLHVICHGENGEAPTFTGTYTHDEARGVCYQERWGHKLWIQAQNLAREQSQQLDSTDCFDQFKYVLDSCWYAGHGGHSVNDKNGWDFRIDPGHDHCP